jgi:hypothetical protein
MFHNKPGFPSHVKVTVSFSMCFGKHIVIVAITAIPIVTSHVVFFFFFLSMFLCMFLLVVVCV